MRRRSFIKSTAASGIGLMVPWHGLTAEAGESAGFLQRRTSGRMLFPRPRHGEAFDISPPGLAWLPAPAAANYRVEIFSEGDRRLYCKNAGPDPVHCPDQVLPAGKYTWDVVALDDNGNPLARRGRHVFKIRQNATALPWIEPAKLLARIPTEHPRILYPKSRLEAIRASLSSTRTKSWEACKAAADLALNKGVPEYPKYHKIEDPVTRRLEYQKYFGYFRGYVNGALMDLALAYLMTEEPKYAVAAKKILLEIASWPTDDEDVTSVSAKWGDEPGLSFSKCAHIAYDWLYDALNEDEKKIVFKMCRERAWQTYRRLRNRTYLTYPGTSHDGRLIAYLTDMSLALGPEIPGAETWLTYSLKALLTFYPHWAGADGGWAEGTAYGLWYNMFYIPAFEGLRQLSNYDLWQRSFFKNVRYFFFYCTANHGEIRPFGDSAEKGGPGVGRGSGYAKLMAFHAHRYDDSYIGWWVRQIPGYRGGSSGFLSLLHPDKLPAKKPTQLPNSRAFHSVGWAGLHSDVSVPEHDTFLLFKSSPHGSVSHSHADQNAFAIMKGGKALAIPSGYYGPSYGKPHHAQWTRSTKANNCILVDGKGQKIRSPAAEGAIVDFEDRPGYSYVAGDATAAYVGRLNQWIRHILFLRPGLFLLLDEIKAPRPSQFQWMLHAFEKMDIQDTAVTSRRHGATLDLYLACPQDLALSQTSEFDTPYNQGIPPAYHEQVADHWHVTAETVNQTRATRIAAVMAVHDDGEPLEVRIQEENGWLGAFASGDFGQVKGWICVDANRDAPPDAAFSSRKEERPVVWGQSAEGDTCARTARVRSGK